MPKQQPPPQPANTGDTPAGSGSGSGSGSGEHDVMTLTEVAAFLRFSEEHTRRLVREGKINGWQIGTSWRFSRAALLRRLSGDDSG